MLHKLRKETDLQKIKYTISTNERTYLINHWTDQHLDISQKLHTALTNIEIVEQELGLPIKHRGPIQIISKDIEYSGLYDSVNDVILIDRELDEIESTLFHELIHYFYPALFDQFKFGGYLREGVPVFYEKQFYPNSWTDIQLLQDRINSEYPLYSVGYFIFKSFFDDIIAALQNGDPLPFFDELNNYLPEIELSHFKDHLTEQILFLNLEADEPTGILFTWDLKSPYIIHLSRDSNPTTGVSFSDRHEQKIRKSQENEWEELCNLIAPFEQQIKQEYQFYSAPSSTLHKWRHYGIQ
ncbi:MAG: hypothetical protein PQJ61_14225 [Spirochaetales bacterium]|uniref:Uncharacterized protein n=1 Tax=Candidatus Thalassospirochaeta sargassi TaxID=3119039 RepID=A0AAJ1IGT1_9SPIO|nr:hypothetical protein [Spirochaetales bacterium]